MSNLEKAKKVVENIIGIVGKAIENNEDLTWERPIVEGLSRACKNCIWNSPYKGLLNCLILHFEGLGHNDFRYVACSWVKSHYRSDGVMFVKGSKWVWITRPVKFPFVLASEASKRGLNPETITDELKKDSRGTIKKYGDDMFGWKIMGYDQLPVVNVRDTVGILDKIKDVDGKLIKSELDSRPESEKPKGSIESLSKMVEILGANVIEINTETPCYCPRTDEIGMQKAGMFKDEYVLSEALAHELIHWTGHKTRMNRDLNNMGEANYSKEELIACLGSSMLLCLLGIDMTGHKIYRQAAYIKNWFKHLQNDPQMLIEATSEAEAAVRYLFKESGMDTVSIEAEAEGELVEA